MPEYVPRPPRYRCIEVEVEVGGSDEPVPAKLVDLSRDGFQIRVPFSCNKDDSITARLGNDASQLTNDACQLTLTGIVQWQSADRPGTWLLGCRSLQRVEMETLGEMFLDGLLATD